MKHLFLFMLLLSGLALSSFAQQTAPPPGAVHNFSLQDCITYAYEHQDTVKNAALDVQSAEYKVKETTGIGLPQISGSASFTDYVKIPTTLIPAQFFGGKEGQFVPVQFGVKYQSGLGLSLSQLLFDGSYLVGLKASRTYKELSQRSLTRSKIDANVNVTKAYYQVLVSNEQIRLLDADLKQLKQQVDQTVAQNKQGFVEQIDVQRIQVQYNNLVTTRENTMRLLALNYQLLKFQMGMPVSEEIDLTDKLENVNLTDNISATGDTSFYHNRIEYGLLETQKKLNDLDVANKKAHFYPTLTLNGNYNSSYQNNSFGDLYKTSFPSSYFGLTLNVPIFSGGQRINQLRQSKIAVLKSQNDLDNAKNAILLQANAAKINYTNGLKSLENQKENQKLAQEVLRVSKIKYSQGVGSSIEVTQAQTDLETADNNYIQSLYDALVSKVDLDKAYGKIQ
ncbi:MAG: TolC family protein [Bacteroidetes bacterium]|jgi:outer membrane protein TolC|nr:TolC family protein [Bacteroidota bacterium]